MYKDHDQLFDLHQISGPTCNSYVSGGLMLNLSLTFKFALALCWVFEAKWSHELPPNPQDGPSKVWLTC